MDNDTSSILESNEKAYAHGKAAVANHGATMINGAGCRDTSEQSNENQTYPKPQQASTGAIIRQQTDNSDAQTPLSPAHSPEPANVATAYDATHQQSTGTENLTGSSSKSIEIVVICHDEGSPEASPAINGDATGKRALMKQGGKGDETAALGSDLKRYRPQKFCAVCGDKAIACNFNAVTCESCKAFFRRNAFKEQRLKCLFENRCIIDRVTRRFCSKCRLLKCFQIGMKREWILTEEQKHKKRVKILQNKQLKNVASSDSSPSPSSTNLPSTLNSNLPAQSVKSIGYPEPINPYLGDQQDTRSSQNGSQQQGQQADNQARPLQRDFKDASTSCPDDSQFPLHYCSMASHCQYCSSKLLSAAKFVAPHASYNNEHHQLIDYQSPVAGIQAQQPQQTRVPAVYSSANQNVASSNACCCLDPIDTSHQLTQTPYNHHSNHLVQHQPQLHVMTPSQVALNLNQQAAAAIFASQQNPVDQHTYSQQQPHLISSGPSNDPTMNTSNHHHQQQQQQPAQYHQHQIIRSQLVSTSDYGGTQSVYTKQQYSRHHPQSRNVNPFVMALEVKPLYDVPTSGGALLQEIDSPTSTLQHQQALMPPTLEPTTIGMDNNNSTRIREVPVVECRKVVRQSKVEESVGDDQYRDIDSMTDRPAKTHQEMQAALTSMNDHDDDDNEDEETHSQTSAMAAAAHSTTPPSTSSSLSSISSIPNGPAIMSSTLSGQVEHSSEYVVWQGEVYYEPADTECEMRLRVEKLDFNEYEKQSIYEMIEATRFMFENANNHDNHKPQNSLNEIVYFCDAALRRLIKTVKQIKAFRMLSMDDQIVLLKTACFKILLLRSTYHFHADLEGWIDTKTGKVMRLDILKRAKKSFVYERHHDLVKKIPEPLRKDRLIMAIMSMTLLFDPSIDLKHSNSVNLDNILYLSILRKYLLKTQPDPLTKYESLVAALQVINACNEEYNVFFSKDFQPEQITPLLIEIFDISIDNSM